MAGFAIGLAIASKGDLASLAEGYGSLGFLPNLFSLRMGRLMMEKRKLIYGALGLLAAAAIYMLGMTQGYYQRITAADYRSVFTSTLQGKKIGDVDLGLLWDVVKTIDDRYFGTPDYSQVAYGAIRGAVAGLGDPYTVFTDPKENESFFNSLDGVYEGIGLEVDIIDGQLTAVAPLAGSPAESAGLRSGDIILAVNGDSVVGKTLAEVLEKIKGPAGTVVVLKVARGEEPAFDVDVRRQVIKRDSVELTIDENKIATIRIFRFAADTQVSVNKAVEKILAENAAGVVLDLRGNPGGFLDAGVYVANEFLAGGQKIVEERFKNGDVTPFTADGKGRLKQIPVAVLVNGGSASASEILAGALQDNKRAVVIGEQSFGKGSVQEVEQFPDGSALRVTVAKWYTPSDRSISEAGITPDKVVELDPAKPDDLQMEAAKQSLLVK